MAHVFLCNIRLLIRFKLNPKDTSAFDVDELECELEATLALLEVFCINNRRRRAVVSYPSL